MVDRDALCLHRVQGNHREARNSIRLGEIQVRPAQRHRCESSADHLSPYPNSDLRHSTPRPWFGKTSCPIAERKPCEYTFGPVFAAILKVTNFQDSQISG